MGEGNFEEVGVCVCVRDKRRSLGVSCTNLGWKGEVRNNNFKPEVDFGCFFP